MGTRPLTRIAETLAEEARGALPGAIGAVGHIFGMIFIAQSRRCGSWALELRAHFAAFDDMPDAVLDVQETSSRCPTAMVVRVITPCIEEETSSLAWRRLLRTCEVRSRTADVATRKVLL